MDVRPLGAGPAETNLARSAGDAAPLGAAATPRAPSAQAIADQYATLIRDLAAADVTKLLAILEPPPSPEHAQRLNSLWQAALSAGSRGDVEQALGVLAELARLDPLGAESLRSDPRLESLRAPVDQLLQRLTTLARVDAEGRLGEAARLLEAGAHSRLPGWETPADALLAAASRLVEAGGYANYIRGGTLAQSLIEGARWAPAVTAMPLETEPVTRKQLVSRGGVQHPIPHRWRRLRNSVVPQFQRLWRRAPLLILLLGWLGLGIAGGTISLLLRTVSPEDWPAGLVDTGFELWSLGLIALILFGFYARVRNVRF